MPARRRRTCEYCGLPTGASPRRVFPMLSPLGLLTGASPRRVFPGLSPLGLLTGEVYSDDEWEAAGNQCEECAIAELADGTLGE